MRSGSKLNRYITILYFVTMAAAVAFLVYITIFEGVESFSTRPSWNMRVYKNVMPEQVEDPDAALGVISRFHLKWEGNGYNDFICFYSVHNNVRIYVDGEKIYTLRVKKDNRFIHTVGSVWVMEPLKQIDEGKEITVDLEPLYEPFINCPQTFYFGSRLQLYRSLLQENVLNLLICFMTVICGIVLVVSSVMRLIRKQDGAANGYLGLFAIMIGIWKILDSKYAPLMFGVSPMAISTISICMLSLCIFPLVNYMRKQTRLKGFPVLEYAGGFAVLMSMTSLVLQLLGILEYRESLVLSHCSVICSVLAIILACGRAWMTERENPRVRMAVLFLAFCVFGALVDLVVFYIYGDSGSILFMVVAFLSYFIFVGFYNNKQLMQRANRDLFTGVFNRSRCNELLKSDVQIKTLSAFALFDLNDLKTTNDTYGHEVGDQMILSFVSILKAEAPAQGFIGRYGGDEFILYLQDVDKEKVKKMLSRIEIGVQMHNASSMGPEVSYCVGMVFSDELDKPALRDLFHAADERMYVQKKKYHEIHDRRKSNR